MPAADIEADILAAIADEARRALAAGVASEADIDLALRLGAGHPVGPFERRAADG
jgi:3-hydroxyacyl-CoA dehydrogenase